MYSVDSLDTVVPLDEVIPVPDPGAPAPILLARDGLLVVVYSLRGLELGQPGPDGRLALVDDLPPAYSPTAVVRFVSPRAHIFGPPNDEAIAGHPLSTRGLDAYGTYEVLHSSWIRELERRNRVHPGHDPRRYGEFRHFIIAFHDSMLECVAEGVDATSFDTDHPSFVGALRSAARSAPG